MTRRLGLLLFFCLLASPVSGAETVYDLDYRATILPTTRTATVRLRVARNGGTLKRLHFQTDPARHREFRGDGTIETKDGEVVWSPPPGGGRLEWTFLIDQLRGDGGYDARCASDWALFRADDMVPPTRSVTVPGARSRARLVLRVPTGWSAVTRYPKEPDGSFRIEDPTRRFLRPTGWLLAADRLGVVRESITGTRVAIAAPAGHEFRRLDILAMLRWTLPDLTRLLGGAPDRLLVVGAGDPMWRGGLSGPGSLFIHAARPLITADTTSPLLHELMHTVLPPPDAESDWLAEGLAERYGLELLVRSRTISRSRLRKAKARLEAKGRQVRTLEGDHASGAVTARAVGVLDELDGLIREVTEGERNLDDVLRGLRANHDHLSTDALRAESERVAGRDLDAFFRRHRLSRGAGRS